MLMLMLMLPRRGGLETRGRLRTGLIPVISVVVPPQNRNEGPSEVLGPPTKKNE